MRNPLIVALDVDEPRIAYKLVEKLHSSVGGFKVGPRLTMKADHAFLKDLSQSGVLFWDHKYFDIPSTTVASVQAAADLGAHWVTVHASVGAPCLRELAQLETKIRESNSIFRILCVTVLTSFTKETLPPIWNSDSISVSVQKLAGAAFTGGLTGVVCSPEEIQSIKTLNPEAFLVVPGIRPAGYPSDDQKRVATPFQALRAGASALVIGRPIVESRDPLQAVKSIEETLKEL